MKKISLVLLLGLALSAVITGCNQSSDNATTPPPASTNAPGTNAP